MTVAERAGIVDRVKTAARSLINLGNSGDEKLLLEQELVALLVAYDATVTAANAQIQQIKSLKKEISEKSLALGEKVDLGAGVSVTPVYPQNDRQTLKLADVLAYCDEHPEFEPILSLVQETPIKPYARISPKAF